MNENHGALAGEREVTEKLLHIRRSRSLELPVKAEVSRFADEVYFAAEEMEGKLLLLKRNLKSVLKPLEPRMLHRVDGTVELFCTKIPELRTGSRILTFCYATAERYLSVEGLFI